MNDEDEDINMAVEGGPFVPEKEGGTFTVGDHKVHVRSVEECNNTADYWVCCRVSDRGLRLARSQKDKCTRCGEEVWFDPGMGINKPPKICMQCLEEVKKEQQVTE